MTEEIGRSLRSIAESIRYAPRALVGSRWSFEAYLSDPGNLEAAAAWYTTMLQYLLKKDGSRRSSALAYLSKRGYRISMIVEGGEVAPIAGLVATDTEIRLPLLTVVMSRAGIQRLGPPIARMGGSVEGEDALRNTNIYLLVDHVSTEEGSYSLPELTAAVEEIESKGGKARGIISFSSSTGDESDSGRMYVGTTPVYWLVSLALKEDPNGKHLTPAPNNELIDFIAGVPEPA